MANKSNNRLRAERIIIAVSLVIVAAVIGFAARGKSYNPTEYDMADTKSGRIEEIINLQNQLFDSSNAIIGKININTASAADLQKLNGIGEKKAADIIAYREKNGPFTAIEDIMKVTGIGEKTFEKIKDNIEV